MNCNEQCFGCHGLYDGDDDIASSRRSSLNALIEDLDVEESDISTIRDFYNQYKKSSFAVGRLEPSGLGCPQPVIYILAYGTSLCWDCALFRVLGYTEKYDDKRNG
jgi:hypothetical protein